MATKQAQPVRIRRGQVGASDARRNDARRNDARRNDAGKPKRPRTIQPQPQAPALDRWHREGASTTHEAAKVIDRVMNAMLARGYPENDVFGMRLALDEAVVNAIKHGHKGNLTKWVQIRYQVTDEHATAVVQDEGPGFNPEDVPDPLADENLERPSGRGLLLMRAYLTWVDFNDRGNIVTLCKRRSR